MLQPKKPADQFVPKPNPEDEDIFVFWDKITKKMARSTIAQFLVWLKTKFDLVYSAVDHGHDIMDIDQLPETILNQQSSLGQMLLEVEELSAIVNKPPAKPTNVEWVVEPTVEIVGTQIIVSAFSIKWFGVLVEYASKTFEAGDLPVAPNIRIDAIYAKEDGTYALVPGTEGPSATRNPIPPGTLWVRDAIWTTQGGTANSQLAFTTELPFTKNILINWNITAPTAFTKDATDFKPGAVIKGNLYADGINKPTFSTDFIINYFEYVNTAGRQHRVFFEAQADGKILVDIVYA